MNEPIHEARLMKANYILQFNRDTPDLLEGQSSIPLKVYQLMVTKSYNLTPDNHSSVTDAPMVWAKFVGELLAQWYYMLKNGVLVEFCDTDPTPKDSEGKISSRLIFEEYRSTHILRVYRSDSEHPVLDKTFITHQGRQESLNSIFRAVHDYFGHFASGAGFGWKGETQAYYSHAQMFSRDALPALYCETVAQQCVYAITGNYAKQRMVIFQEAFFSPNFQ